MSANVYELYWDWYVKYTPLKTLGAKGPNEVKYRVC